MTSLEASASALAPSSRLPLWSIARQLMAARLKAAGAGSLSIAFPDGGIIRHQGREAGPAAELSLHRWRALWRLFSDGDVGLARAYLDGDCSTSDLKALLMFGAANASTLSRALSSSKLSVLCSRVRHRLKRNTRRGSRRNIAAHYDLGNEFYKPWLDRTMSYSSALYTAGGQSLESAQEAKLERIAALLELQNGHNVLEIGCGWGGLAKHLAAKRDCSVTGITLSVEQLQHARSSLAGSGTRVDFQLADYRDVPGRYDRIVSVEMLEAVGERYWPVYFQKLRDSLTSDGVAVLQVITIADGVFEEYRRRPDFIQQFIFPGGMLPTAQVIREQAERVGLRLELHQDFGPSYATTLLEWRQRFLSAWHGIEALGFDERFRRMWEYYLAYCEAGFDTGAISVGLFKFRPS
ncbi:cyclopropane-fatty-acyl-phospholipid synthase [Rhodoplanes sp. Z2-YC6860]|nr:cyclopropane-fatty-acyl-phospholipid synthase [Rhodoplanes sp. Z2-YC6860]